VQQSSLHRVAGDRSVLLGLLLYLLVAVVPTLVFWLALRLLPAAVTAVSQRRRSRRCVPGPALETVVADLRRLRREVCGPAQPTRVRRVALLAAYDETLLDACLVVGVDAPLATSAGSDRALARLRTEAALEDAGIALDPFVGGSARGLPPPEA